MVVDILSSQGPDGRYTLMQNDPTIQLYKDNITFVVQGQHMTEKHLYVDNLHIAVEPQSSSAPNGPAIAYAFSHSQDFVPGNFAYSDGGQNYKNLAYLIKAMAAKDGIKYNEKTLFGCPAKAPVTPVSEYVLA